MDKKDIMEKLGMPRATFYRRLKAMQEYTGEYDRLF
jgi:DNA-binding IclR family transcriptional regulator